MIGEPSSRGLKVAICAGVWFLALANVYHLRFADPDVWWYLRCGDDILSTGQIQQVDHYSFTAAGLPYLNHEWLAQVLFALAFNRLGPVGLVLLKLLVGVAFLGVFHCLLRLRSADPRIYLPLFLLGAHGVGRYALFRPQIFTFLFFTIVLFILERHRRRPDRLIWLLPAVTCLWANLHAGFVVGLVLIGLYWCALKWTRVPGLVLLASLAASLVNPHGVFLWRSVLEAVLDPSNRMNVQEWQPLFSAPLTWNQIVYAAVCALALVGFVLGRGGGWDGFTVVLFALFTLTARRHIPLFVIVALPPAAEWLTRWMSRQPARPARKWFVAGGTGLILIPVLLTTYYTLEDPRPRVRILDAHYRGFPYAAVELLQRQPGGNVWTELEWGGYLLWKLGPSWKVSIDGRNTTVYPREVVADHFQIASTNPPGVEVLAKYNADVCLLHAGRAFVARMESSDTWRKIYENDVAVMFRNRASTHRLDDGSTTRSAVRPPELFMTKGR